MEDLRFRQIHLDFHTSEHIGGVGSDFNASEFADTLKKAHVDSVTCFARCHHGLLYYNSKAFPDRIHPHLKNPDLLADQIKVCHENGIRVPVYTTVQWDYAVSQQHPDWCCLSSDGALVDFCGDGSASVFEPGFYRTLCVNTPYRDYLKEHVKDIFEVIGPENIDGLFLDIVNITDCSCAYCTGRMKEEGYNPAVKEERVEFARAMITEFKQDMSDYIRSFRRDLSIFYNAGHVDHTCVDGMGAYSHWELESLPSGEWGYSHFPNTVRFARTTGMPYLAQTGKFHTFWGDFHSLKNQEALEYECFRMLAYNAKCLIGDQLEPSGKISGPAYDLIGNVYGEVEEKEPWCRGAVSLADIAVFTPESLTTSSGCGGVVPPAVNGCCAMLDEMGYQLDIVEIRSDLSGYKVLILPDDVICDEELARKIEDFVKKGGALLATAESGLDPSRSDFTLDCLGLNYKGMRELWPDFIIANDVIGKSLPVTEYVMYNRGHEVESETAEALLSCTVPYFSRTWEHFCSHQHTPSSGRKGSPGAYRNGDAVYFAHPVFTMYQEKHPRWCKEIIRDALDLLLPEPLIRTDGPGTMVTTINEQPDANRYVLHVLHYIPVKVSQELYTIEDVIPLHNVGFELILPGKVKGVRTVPGNRDITFSKEGDKIAFTVPEINGHCMIELDYI